MGRKKSAESLPAKCDLDSESDMAHGIVQLCHVFFRWWWLMTMFRMLSKFGVNVLWPHRVVRPAVSWGHRSPNTKVKQALSRVHSPHRRFCCKLRVRKSFFDHTHGLQMIARCFPPKPASLWPRVLRNWVEGFRTTSWYRGNLKESPARFGQERAQLVHLAVFLALDHGAMGVEAWADRRKGKDMVSVQHLFGDLLNQPSRLASPDFPPSQ